MVRLPSPVDVVSVEAPPLSSTLGPARRALFLALVALVPLHTVFLSAWVSWKPFIAVLIATAAIDIVTGWQARRWPWHRQASLAAAVFLALAALSWAGGAGADRFLRLFLALGVGAVLMLVTDRSLRPAGMWERALRTAFWTGAAMGATALLFTLLSVGALGEGNIDAVNDLPGVHRVFKPAFLDEGFVALTNWHQDPGYAAAWMNLWIVLVLAASVRGLGSGRRWGDALVLGGLGFGVLMTLNRTGWGGLVVAVIVSAVLFVRAGWIDRNSMLRRIGAGALVAAAALGSVALLDPADVGGDIDTEFGVRIDQVQALLGLGDPPESGAIGPAPFEGGEERFAVWPEYVDFFASSPLRGVGLGVGWETSSLSQEPHNIALELLGETGLAGFLGFAGLLAVVVVRGQGPIGAAVLSVALAAAITQTVLFEATWWLAAALFLAGESDRTAAISRPSRR